MRSLFIGLTMAAIAGTAGAETIRVETEKSVPEAADALAAAIDGAGATLFARVDHGAGASSVGSDIGASQLIIFGNPKVGTPAMIEDRLAGLALPLQVLVYEDAEGAVWLAYQSPQSRIAAATGESPEDAVTMPMSKALEMLTSKAAGGM